MTSACPAREQLERLLKEQLADAERHAVEGHVQHCKFCQGRLDRLLDVDREDCLPPRSSTAASSELASATTDVLERLKQCRLGRDAAQGVSQSILQFPGAPTPLGPLGQLRSYHMIELLGAGATGYVYKAYDQDLDRLVAIKVLRPDLEVLGGSRVRFLREARAAAKIRHENVVGIHKVERVSEFALPFIVMEYVEGETLAARVEREPALPVEEAVTIIRQVAIGLSAAHDRGMAHRDIKPSNILLQMRRVLPGGSEGTKDDPPNSLADSSDPAPSESLAAGQSYVAKITDFGLARAVEAADQESRHRLTRTGHMLGTPAYMSPEHILTPEKVGAQSDVYSLGVVLYELLTGQLPFAGTAHQVLMQVVQCDPVAPRLRNVHVPPALSDITLACLAKEPARRYLSARELAVELERWQAGHKVRVRPLSVTGKLARWSSRNAALASAWTVTGLLGVVILLLGLLLAHVRAAADLRLRGEREQTTSIRTENKRLAANLSLERGLTKCNDGRTDQGLLWLTRALELAPQEAKDLQWSIRAQLAAWSKTVAKLERIFPRQGRVRAVGFSQDGKLLLTHCDGHEWWKWDIATGRLVNSPATNAQGISAATFSRDGRSVLIGVESGALWIVDEKIGKPQHLENCHDGEVTALAFSADSSCYVTGGQDKTAQRWKVGTLKAEPLGPRLEHPSTVEAVAFSPDGQMILTGCADNHARLWDANSSKLVGTPLAHEGVVTAVAFSPDGRMLLTTSKDHTARLWDASTGKPIGSPLLHKDKVFAGVFSADGRLIATGSNDCTARLWDARTGVAVGAPLLHDGPVYTVAFNPDGRRLATGGEDLVVRLWQLPDVQPHEHRVAPEGRTTVLAFSPDGLSIAIAVDSLEHQFVQAFDSKSWEAIGPPLRLDGIALGVTFRPDGKLLLTHGSRTVSFWNAATGEPVDPPIQLDNTVYSVAISPDGQTVLTGDEDRCVCFWDALTHAALRKPLTHQGAVYALAFSPNGRLLLSGSWDKTAQLWDVQSGARRGNPLRHNGPVMSVAFSPNGKLFVTGSRDSTAQVWNTETGEPVGLPMAHRQPVQTVAFSPDGRMVASGSEDDTACLWDMTTRYRLGPPLVHGNNVSVVAFRPDGRVLVTAAEENVVRVWTVPSPVEGDVERIGLWLQLATGLELEADGRVRLLPAETWFQRHQRLTQLGGPVNQ